MDKVNIDGVEHIVTKGGNVRPDIKWEDGTVCYACGWQWFDYQGDTLIDNVEIIDGAYTELYCNVIKEQDFQLNEPRQGDYIPKSELDTEQKYNDAVGELGLFGFVFCGSSISEYSKLNKHDFITCCDDGLWQTSSDRWNKRPLTYNQLMAIGKLKRLMNERDKVNTSEKPNSSELKDGDKYIRTIYGLCGTPVKVDVYRVSDAFPTGSAPIDHAVKKMLCAGLRGHKDKLTDIDNAVESLQAARLLLIQKGEV